MGRIGEGFFVDQPIRSASTRDLLRTLWLGPGLVLAFALNRSTPTRIGAVPVRALDNFFASEDGELLMRITSLYSTVLDHWFSFFLSNLGHTTSRDRIRIRVE